MKRALTLSDMVDPKSNHLWIFWCVCGHSLTGRTIEAVEAAEAEHLAYIRATGAEHERVSGTSTGSGGSRGLR